jgi:DNA adenine methylase
MSIISEMKNSKAKPFLKWAGGKQSLKNELIEHFPQDYETYYEPFLGGGSVLFELEPENSVVGDANEWLIDTFKAIRENWKRVAKALDFLPNTKEQYLKLRAVNPNTLSQHKRAALLIYLNKTCFRGLFRVNQKGYFNVPYGSYDRRYYDESNLQRVAQTLKNVELSAADYESVTFGASSSDFIYFDPPYYKLGGYSDFDRYTKLKFKEEEHIRLASFCRELDKKNVRWAVSNSNTTLVRKLFKGFRIVELNARREINLNSSMRNIRELFILNY